MVLPAVGWALFHQLVITKMPHSQAHRRQSLVDLLSCQVTSSHQVDRKLTSAGRKDGKEGGGREEGERGEEEGGKERGKEEGRDEGGRGTNDPVLM